MDSEDSNQADVSLCWAHESFCLFCHATGSFMFLSSAKIFNKSFLRGLAEPLGMKDMTFQLQ